jgi:non-ribosomal peptide synthetase component F
MVEPQQSSILGAGSEEDGDDEATLKTFPPLPLCKVHEWAAAASPPCPPVLYHELLLQQEKRTPYNTALALGNGQQVTYRALCSAARAMAASLRQAGVRAGALVGLLAVRNLEMVIGMLGILFANAGYVPLMPEFPEDRMRFILDDAAVEIMGISRRFLRIATALRS